MKTAIEEEEALECYDKDRLREIIQPAIDKAKEFGLQLYCSEFGCLPAVDREIRLQYYQDITDIFRENNIFWSSWDYKGDFRIVDYDREKSLNLEPDFELIKILTK